MTPFLLLINSFLITRGAKKRIVDDIIDGNSRAAACNQATGIWTMTKADSTGFSMEKDGRTFRYEWPHGVAYDEETKTIHRRLDLMRPKVPQEIRSILTAPEHEADRNLFLMFDEDNQRRVLAKLGLTEHEIDLNLPHIVEAVEAVTLYEALAA